MTSKMTFTTAVSAAMILAVVLQTNANPNYYTGLSGTGVKHYGLYKQNSISLYHDAHVRRCVEKSLEAREAVSDVVFTGTVRDLVPTLADDGLTKARVEVKRIMKGASVLGRVATGWTMDEHGSRRLVVDVRGIGDQTICNSEARINDTRIFLVAKTSSGELRLNSSLVRMSLDNIEQAEAAVHSKSMVKTPWPTGRYPAAENAIISAAHKYSPSKHAEKPMKSALTTSEPMTAMKRVTTMTPSISTRRGEARTTQKMTTMKTVTKKPITRSVATKPPITKKPSTVTPPMTTPRPVVTTYLMKAIKTMTTQSRTTSTRLPLRQVTMPTEDNQTVWKSTSKQDLVPILLLVDELNDTVAMTTGHDQTVLQSTSKQDTVPSLLLIDELNHEVFMPTGYDQTVLQSTSKQDTVPILLLVDELSHEGSMLTGPDQTVLQSTSKQDTVPSLLLVDALNDKVAMTTGYDQTVLQSTSIQDTVPILLLVDELINMVTMPTELVTTTNVPGVLETVETVLINASTEDSTGCSSIHCLFGAECFALRDQAPSCRCPDLRSCGRFSGSDVTASSRVVCGSNLVTYLSECHLRVASCLAQSPIGIKLYGPCDNIIQETFEIITDKHNVDGEHSLTRPRDPCDGHSCSFGARCISSADGRSARCHCDLQCDDDSHTGSDVTVTRVCGDDGVDYSSECEMRRRGCVEMRVVAKKYDGKCDPCDGIECAVAQVCQLDSARRPVCRCGGSGAGGVCPMEFEPVCASDGATYSNECVMTATACRKRLTDIRVVYRGECSSGRNPCSRPSVCPGVGELCTVDRDGTARCTCIPPCPAILSPVCGTDGQTYDNLCSLERDACLTKRTIAVSHTGVCNGTGVCLHHVCEHGTSCVVKDAQPQCVCPMCSGVLHPVCGNDGMTYENECKLRSNNCEKKTNVTILHHGTCDTCAEKKCEFFSNCETDEKGIGRCVCPTGCVQVENTVCGSNGVTYTNECEMRIASCKLQSVIAVVSRGACDLCAEVKCRYGARCDNGRCVCQHECPPAIAQSGDVSSSVVCGTDGVSYNSECALRRAACTRGVEITAVHAGMCEDFLAGSGSGATPSSCDSTTCRFGGKCQTDNDGSASCSCNFNCDAFRSRVCGTDGVTYGNDCQMREESCKKQIEIRAQSMDNCEEMDEELCDGNPALRNPENGREYNCNPGQDTCPAASYCHKVSNIARCCREDIRSCDDTMFGCCPDGLTASLGPNNAGCPNVCQCNGLGSYGVTCDPVTRQCTCKPGVGGLRCDRCEPNYWGLPKIAEGNSGCLPCNCNLLGSLREDCDQNTGRCMCRPGVAGQKCNICPNGKHLSYTGCTDLMMNDHQNQARACSDHRCRFGAVCHVTNGIPDCVCPASCQDSDVSRSDVNPLVCGSDSKTYGSACQLKLFSCRLQKDITIAHYGPCSEGSTTTSTAVAAVQPSTKQQHRRTTSNNRSRITKHLAEPTPVTSLYGVIGDFCLDDSYCYVRNSFCSNGQCACQNKLLPSNDNTVCSEDIITVPSFSGTSYIQLKKLKHGNRDITIEINFKPMRKDGILFYAAQTFDGRGDYIAVSLRNGLVEFRFDLGSGSALLKSSEKVELNKFHRVTARRFGKDGVLRVNDRVEVSGTSPGMLQSLNLETPLFLGFVPNATTLLMRNIGVTAGFFGCIDMLKVNSSEMSLTYDLSQQSSTYVESRSNIKECDRSLCAEQPCMQGGTCVESHDGVSFTCQCPGGYSGVLCESEIVDDNPCNRNPCEGGGNCIALAEGGFICKCPDDRDGELCEKVDPASATATASSAVTIPQFHGDSYLTLKLGKAASRSLSFEVWFLSYEPNGVLVYSSQEGVDRGDFIALNIINERLQLRYNLGSGSANITSTNRIRLNVWNKAVVSRMKRFGMLSLNDATPAKGRSTGLLEELNLPLQLYVGGNPSGRYHPDSGVTVGLRGAIQRFYKDGQLIEDLVGSSTEKNHVTQYDGPPCPADRNPCRHNGRCLSRMNDFECQCTDGYTGRLCQHAVSQKSVSFDGRTYHRYHNAVQTPMKSQTSNRFEVRFRSVAKNGLILMQTKWNSVDTDYLAMALNDGHPEVSFNLGKERASDLLVLVSKVNVTDGLWHTLLFTRDKRIAHFSVDQEIPTATTVSSPEATTLDTDGSLWIGGHRTPPRGLPESYYKNFEGCIEYVQVGDEPLDLVKDRISKDEVKFCEDALHPRSKSWW